VAEPSRAQQLYGDLAPKMVEIVDGLNFGDIWQRPGLTPRERSLVTVSALISMYRASSLESQFKLALQNGLTPEDLGEVVTQLALYTGLPCATMAIATLKSVLSTLSD
jgi:4-carboxymuconolactone decarboxylase